VEEQRGNKIANSKDDRQTIIGRLKKKAIKAQSKFRHSLRKKAGERMRENASLSNSLEIDDVRHVKELQAMVAFKHGLI
jgi:hypothetical protein